MIHCNTGYCTTLLHNKDVVLKGFLRGCRPTRLNHVTLVFLVFLFYTFLSASTLAYTIWYNTSHCYNIFNNSLPYENGLCKLNIVRIKDINELRK